MTYRKWALVAAGPALALVVASCSSSHSGSAPATSASPAAPTSSAGSSGTGPSTVSTVPATTGTPATAPSGPARCATASLGVALTNPNGAAGSVYYTLLFVNRGSTACVLQGWPGVSFVTGPGGTQVGAAAARTPVSVPTVTLQPGRGAGASLQITEATNYGTACGITTVAGLRIYPPDQTAALYIAHSDRACSNTNDVTLHVGAVQATR